MKKTIAVFGLLVSFAAYCFGAAPKFVGATPASGSTFSRDLTITYEFDLSDIIAEYGLADYGVGYLGGNLVITDENGNFIKDENGLNVTVAQRVAIYKDVIDESALVASTNTTRVTGKTEGFSIGNTITATFTNIEAVPGSTYYVVMYNNVNVYKVGVSTKTGDSLVFATNPLVLTYKAEKVSEGLELEECTLRNDCEVETPGKFTLQFNNDIEIDNTKLVTLYDEFAKKTVAEGYLLPTSDGNIAYTDFSAFPAYKSHNYTLTIPAGIAKSKADGTLSKEIVRTFKGTKQVFVSAKSISPDPREKQVFESFTVEFDINDPDVYIATPDNYFNYFIGGSYIGDISEENKWYSFFGKEQADGRSVKYSVPAPIEPEKTYNFVLIQGAFTMLRNCGGTIKQDPAFKNDRVVITYTTPSVEEYDMPKMDFDTPFVGDLLDKKQFIDGGSYNSIASLDLQLKGDLFEYNGIKRYADVRADKSPYGYIYEVSGDEEKLIKDFLVMKNLREPNSWTTYYAITLNLDATFYKGKEYKIVVPAGILGNNYADIKYYWTNDELVYHVKGYTDAEIKLASTSHNEGDEVSELSYFTATFTGTWELAEGKEVAVTINNGKFDVIYGYVPTITQYDNNTILSILTLDRFGNPRQLEDGYTAAITLPEGLLKYSADENFTSMEHVINLRGISEESRFVNLDITVNGGHTSSVKTLKDRAMTLQLTPNADWKVTSLTTEHEGAVVWNSGSGTSLTVTPTEDLAIVAEIEYAGAWMVEQSSGVFGIADSAVKVYARNGQVIIEGVSPTDAIAVYSTGGLLLHNVTAEQDIVRISLPAGIYVVTVNGHACKISV